MKNKNITLKEIEDIKEKAEKYIFEILKKVEQDTGLVCTDIKLYCDEELKFNCVRLGLEVEHYDETYF